MSKTPKIAINGKDYHIKTGTKTGVYVYNGTFSENSQNAMTALYEYYLKAKAYKGEN